MSQRAGSTYHIDFNQSGQFARRHLSYENRHASMSTMQLQLALQCARIYVLYVRTSVLTYCTAVRCTSDECHTTSACAKDAVLKPQKYKKYVVFENSQGKSGAKVGRYEYSLVG